MSDSYKFVGVLNLFDVYPDFVFPIYKKDDKLFFHNGENNRIFNFDEVTNSVLDKIIYINNTDINIINNAKSVYYYDTSAPVYAFQKDEHEIFCSDLEDMILFLSRFVTEDIILKKQIDLFIFENIPEFKNNLLNSFELEHTNNRNSLLVNMHNAILKEVYTPIKPLASLQISPSFINKTSSLKSRNLNDCIAIIEADFKKMNEKQNQISSIALIESKLLAREIDNIGYVLNKNIEGFKNIFTYEVDFSNLKMEFDTIIKSIPFSSPLYDVCIKCQNAIINKDEEELVSLINKNIVLFYSLNNMAIQNNCLFEYIQSHLYPNAFEYQ